MASMKIFYFYIINKRLEPSTCLILFTNTDAKRIIKRNLHYYGNYDKKYCL